MALRIISADERLKALQGKNTIAIAGPTGVGKTSLLHTLPDDSTLAIDIEAGMKSVQDWRGDSIPVRTFTDFADISCLIGGANPALRDSDFYSAAHYEHVKKTYASLDLRKYATLFTDSITDLTRIGMHYAKTTPAAYSDKTGKDDIRGAYGELARQVIDALKHLQHAPMVNIVFVGILELVTDDAKRSTWQMQMEGAKVGRELPGIVNNVVTMSRFDFTAAGPIHNPEKGEHRALVCQPNLWGLPAKDRTGNLDILEEPHLGRLIEKMNRSQRAASERLTIAHPVAAT